MTNDFDLSPRILRPLQDNAITIDCNVQDVRRYLGGVEGSGEKIEAALDSAQGEVWLGAVDEMFIVIRIRDRHD